ncbi:MAG: leucine-rich repeat protein [Alistipes sp.]|nr:leucine-rich repeat protein [Alistipes sp.]
MKKLFLLLALLGVVATGCSKDEGGRENNIPENIFFGLDKESVTISPDGGSVDVIVYSNYKWEISGTSDWCTPSVKGGDANEDGQKVTFSAGVAYDDREATFWFRCADKQIKFVVSQKSTNVIIYYTSSNGEIVQPNDSSAFDATIISNTYIDGVGVIEFDGAITMIGEYAFYECYSLTSVTFPDSVTEIGWSAFYGCRSLTSVTIGNSVTTIGQYAFYDCNKLTSVTIPDSVTTIGNNAFQYCSSLTSVTIPDSVTAIRYAAFEDCSSLTSVTIGDSVTTIGDSAFAYCRSLTSVTIPDSVTSIGTEAFNGCSSLTSVYCKATTPPVALTSFWYWRAFDNNASGRKIYVPMESVGAYKSASYWSDYKSSIVGYNF